MVLLKEGLNDLVFRIKNYVLNTGLIGLSNVLNILFMIEQKNVENINLIFDNFVVRNYIMNIKVIISNVDHIIDHLHIEI